MSARRFSEHLKPLSPGQRLRSAVNVARQNALASLLQETAEGRYVRGGPGIRVKSGAQGVSVSLMRRPLNRPVIFGNLHVYNDGRVKAGTIAGIMPEIDADRLDDLPAPTLDIPASGTKHVVVTVVVTLTVIASVYVASWSIADGGVTIDVESAAPEAADLLSTTGTFKFLLATFVDGVRTYQRTPGDIAVQICDDATATGTARLTLL